MRVVTGDLWSELGLAELLLVTTNAVVTQDGRLVMGRGAAREARDRFAGLDRDLGEVIRSMASPIEQHLVQYGVALARGTYHPITRLGAFQVKAHWQDAASPELIAYSCGRLAAIADRYHRIALNFPGIGAGGLPAEQVTPLLLVLPDHVLIYRKTS